MGRSIICLFVFAWLNAFSLAAQQKVEGRVLEQDTDEPLIGVTVMVKNTSLGTVTDLEGNYQIEIPDDKSEPILVFSYIGFESIEIPVNGRTKIDAVLRSDLQQLDEVVVVGYGNQKRSDVTYAIASVGKEELQSKPVTGLDQALQGEVAGVNVSQASGAPGGGVSVQIRGVQTITAGAEPLYVIDGFPFYNSGGGAGTNPLNTLNPADIESIDVLKDAAATAVYGSRGANGVIIITTKRGEKGKANIQFNMYEGVQTLGNSIEMMGREEFLEFQKIARNNYYTALGYSEDDGVVPRYLNVGNNAMLIEDTLYQDYPNFSGETNWYDEIFRAASMRNYQLSATGGTDNVNYLISGGYFSQDGLVQGTSFDRYTFRANIDAKLNEFFNAGISLSPSLSNQESQNTSGSFANGGLINAAMVLAPIFPVHEKDGETYFSPRVAGSDRFFTNFIVDGRTINPLRPALPGAENPLKLVNSRLNESQNFRTVGNLYVELTPLKNLTFRSSFGADVFLTNGRTFNGALYPQIQGSELGRATAYSNQVVNWINENSLTYNLNINNDHRLNVLLNYSLQKQTNQSSSVGVNQMTDEMNTYVNTVFGVLQSANANISYWSLESYLGRVQYVFKDKYLLTASARMDGSSRFGPDNRYGFFPSGSLGWRFTEENFFPSSFIIEDGKLRVSYGEVGNFNIGNFDWIGQVSGVTYVLGAGAGMPVGGNQQTTMGNSNLSWETSKQFNIGFDIGLFKNRINLIGDYYRTLTDGLLLESKVSMVSGFLDVLRNVGAVENKGFEFTMNSKNLVKKFRWETDFNISFNKNEVKSLSTSGERLFTGAFHVTQVGSPIGSFFMIKSDGVYMDDEDVEANMVSIQGQTPYPGARKYVDYDENGIIDDADRQIVGSPFPDYTVGLSNSFSYAGFDLRVQLYGSIGGEIINEGKAMSESASGFHNNTMRYWKNRYISPDQPGDGESPLPMATTRVWNNQLRASYLIEDASYVRVRSVIFGYRLPQKWINKAAISNARLYVSGQNLFTFTNYTGFDPEVSSYGTTATLRGVDMGGYPIPRIVTLGLDLSF